ncbi:unnamed protein product [Rotaria socialis]|uniref:Uncharacterized protein n=2 Tax=Rotaria socialis TaxID=392032 RepID=A0A820XZC5_9BILA|nr:unnamed protein product [Rotaria socialis]CAF4535425.1 unnamed protein product [Rotaria socialis]
MIIRSAMLVSKSRNQPSRECLYAWYPEVSTDIESVVSLEPRDIYIHNGIDTNLLQQKSSKHALTNTCDDNNKTGVEFVRRSQSVASSNRPYHSIETINEALSPPWALHYETKHRPATSNFSSNSSGMSIHQETSRRLKSAPVSRSLPTAPVLTIPEPRFINVVIPVAATNEILPSSPSSSSKNPASSAKARLNTSMPSDNKQQRREIKSAHASRSKVNANLSDEELHQILKRVYGDQTEQTSVQQEQPIQIVYTQAKPSSASTSPVYVYQKSASWCGGGDEASVTSARKSLDVNAVLLNPHHVHRPALIAVKNVEKKPVVRANSALIKPPKHHHCHRRYHHSHGRPNGPLIAVTSTPQKPKLSLEIDGVILKYDPKLNLEDKSANLSKYFIDGRLYLIKDQRYNVLDNIDSAKLEKYNQTLASSSHIKHYQAIPMDKFQIPQPATDLPHNPSSKQAHRCFINPNLISENLNVNRMSLSKRPPTATVYA